MNNTLSAKHEQKHSLEKAVAKLVEKVSHSPVKESRHAYTITLVRPDSDTKDAIDGLIQSRHAIQVRQYGRGGDSDIALRFDKSEAARDELQFLMDALKERADMCKVKGYGR